MPIGWLARTITTMQDTTARKLETAMETRFSVVQREYAARCAVAASV